MSSCDRPASTPEALGFKPGASTAERNGVSGRTQLSVRLALIGIVTAVAVLVAAPIAWGANESISGTVTDGDTAEPLAGICVTAESDTNVIVRTTAANGTYTIPVAPGSYIVRFDDCGTSFFETEYWEEARGPGAATAVVVEADEQEPGVNATLLSVTRDDDGAPDTNIDTGPEGETAEFDVAFTFSSNDDEANFECSFDGGPFEGCFSGQEYLGLADGPHQFAVRAVDIHGNRDVTPATSSFVVDSPAPDGIIQDGPEGTVHTRDVRFDFSSDDPDNSQYACKLDEGGFEPCSSPQIYEDLAEGPHTFMVRATHRTVGEGDQTPAVQSFYVQIDGPEDNDPPTTTITSGPEGTIGTSGGAFEFEASETWSTFECSVDDGAFEPCSSPTVVTGLPNGEHTFAVRATDPAGNTQEVPTTRTFIVDTTVDTTPPDTAINSGPTGAIGEDFAVFTFSSTEGNSTFRCRLNEGEWDICTSPRVYTDLAPGSYTFEVAARDSKLNEDPSPAEESFVVSESVEPDTIPPDTAILDGPDEGAAIGSQSVSFDFTSSQAGSSFECRMDDDPWRTCVSERFYGGLSEGDHTFQVRATDPAGNRDGDPATRNFSVDVTAPNTIYVEGPDGQRINSPSATYTFDSTEDGSTFECKVDGSDWAECQSPLALSGLSEGTHTVAIRARDRVGNTDTTPFTSSFMVDVTPPDTIIDSGPSGTVSDPGEVVFHATEDASFRCRIDGGTWSDCDSPHSLGTLSDGTHTFDVQATDSAGNVEVSPASTTFTVDTTGPDAAVTSGPTGTITTRSATFAFTAPDATAFQCQLDGAGWTPCTSPQSYSGLANGTHTFQVRARDSLGNLGAPDSRTFTVNVTTTNPPPTGPGPECAAAVKKLESAQKALKKAQKKAKKAKGKAKKKAKKKLKKAKANVKKAQSAVAAAC